MAARIPQSFIQDLIDRTDIVAMIGERVQLKKAGQNYQARCPFHDEKSPSFTVSATKQFYYCFGCGAHGNIVSFLMEYDRMEFLEAVELLATHHGLAIPNEDSQHNPEEYKQRQNSYALLKKVSDFYEQELKSSTVAIDYLKSRGLTGRVAKDFLLGYAPESWENLTNLAENNIEQNLLIENGLLIAPKNYPRFRHRVMFPIRNSRGQIIGFGGRSLTKEDQPKYMNSPETPVFHKGQELYGLYEALTRQRKLEFAICVEGYMDVIALHQHGFPQAVATLGTAISIKHVQKLLRFTEEIVFCFDGDNAGNQAAWKALTIAMPLLRDGIQFRFLFITNNEDPDNLVRRIGKVGFAQRLKTAKPLSEVFFELLQQQMPIATIDDKTRFAQHANEYISAMPHGLYRELLLRRLAEILGLYRADMDFLESKKESAAPAITHPQPSNNMSPLVRKLLRMLLQQPKLAQEINSELPDETLIAGLPLFKWVQRLFAEHPNLTVGKLLAQLPQDHSAQVFLAQMASEPSLLTEDLLRVEFIDGVAQLAQLGRAQQLTQLQQKAQQTALNSEEKQILSKLLDNCE